MPLSNFLISSAYAQDALASPQAATSGMFMQLIPFVLIFAVFYFILLRPQQKKFNEHKQMLDNIRRGDKIVTGGGIIGSIVKLDGPEHLVVEIAEGVKVKILRNTVQTVLAKTEPAANDTAVAPPAEDKKA